MSNPAKSAYEAMCAQGYVGMSPKVLAGSIAGWDQLGDAERAAWTATVRAAFEASVPMLSTLLRDRERVNEALTESGGYWHACSGCHETEDGHPTGRYACSATLDIEVGSGCSECGGLGARWDELAEFGDLGEPNVAEASPEIGYAIGSYLLSGWLPWGVDFVERLGKTRPSLSLCRGGGREPDRWILCCGHVISIETMDQWLAGGLTIEGEPDHHGRRTVVAGPALAGWVAGQWEALHPSVEAAPL